MRPRWTGDACNTQSGRARLSHADRHYCCTLGRGGMPRGSTRRPALRHWPMVGWHNARHFQRSTPGRAVRDCHNGSWWGSAAAGKYANPRNGNVVLRLGFSVSTKAEVMMNLAFPFGFDTTGRTTQTDVAAHVRDMVELILFTSPGERVNRPTFGSGTAQLVFAPNSSVLAAAQQQAIQAGLQQWLSDLIRVQSVTVLAEDATLQVTVVYLLVANQQQQSQKFLYGGPTQ